MQVGIDSFAAAFDENSRAMNPVDRLRQLVEWGAYVHSAERLRA
jgi:hypothetical protein